MELEQIHELIKKLGSRGYRDGSTARRGKLYHPIPFEEFAGCRVHKRNIPQEYEIICSNYGDFTDKRVLDIGCANGYYTFKIAQTAKEVIAIEGDQFVYDVNVAIQQYKNIDNISFRNEYFNECIAEQLEGSFDVGIMMNVHMWIYKQIGDERTRTMLETLSEKVKTLYFQTSHKVSGGMYRVKMLENVDQVLSYLIECGFSNTELIQETTKHGGIRALFRCEK